MDPWALASEIAAKVPLWFKHFDRGPDGAGEAYHLGIFGKTGSGKSVLAKLILLAYARYKKVALLVIDPHGEFSRDMRKDSEGTEDFPLRVGQIVRSLGKETGILTVRNLVLDRWELFEQILFESVFFERLTVTKGENRQIACAVIVEKRSKGQHPLEESLSTRVLRQSVDNPWRSQYESNRLKKWLTLRRSNSSRGASASEGSEPLRSGILAGRLRSR